MSQNGPREGWVEVSRYGEGEGVGLEKIEDREDSLQRREKRGMQWENENNATQLDNLRQHVYFGMWKQSYHEFITRKSYELLLDR